MCAPAAETVPACGWYRTHSEAGKVPVAWLTFYRAWHQTGDLEVVDALVEKLRERGFEVGAFYCQSLREKTAQEMLMQSARGGAKPDVILTLQSFTVGNVGGDPGAFLEAFRCPVLQVPVATGPRSFWEESPGGLSPSEVAIQVALPEIDGRVLSSVAGFKEESTVLAEAECVLKRLKPDFLQCDFIAELAANWARLRTLPASQKRVAIVLSNYPNRDGRIGNGVGLDTPASTVAVLRALKGAGFGVDGIPHDGAGLMQRLLSGVTNDPEGSFGKHCGQGISGKVVGDSIAEWPAARLSEFRRHWGEVLPDL
ncbi:MAG: hypothetical protein EBS01_13015 [Verrucomicrobia bacterium]|nr:hypothetical protein [Verrucomicrobiota bacterium]